MCGNGLIGMAHAQLRATAGTPDGAVREHPGSAIEATAEIQDLHSRPMQAIEVLPLVTGERRVPRVARA
jgi:hypothetical protein